jgi:acyl-coenzyme A thioesterase PaaI-like protein
MAKTLGSKLGNMLPEKLRNTLGVRAFGLFKIPLLFFVSPTVLDLSDQRCVVRIPLNRRTRNHLKSMYFGTLACGADISGGLIAMRLIGNKASLVFKDFHAEFLKRPESDVLFTCEDGPVIQELVRKTLASDERQHAPVQVVATCPDKFGSEPVAKFTLTLSLKRRGAAG